ncbi:hypothetical protein Agub_g13126 [Astrephomene gubernaculifera]|uniref:Uncharacterized protein n=1 Tax=Astrephomene gubernaculifera TaxID=47775 RepID=A0AAD3E3S5_9CHLO|nr:hypothetical protein Agub_g13126 [Astrephomene gubernaculifera]
MHMPASPALASLSTSWASSLKALPCRKPATVLQRQKEPRSPLARCLTAPANRAGHTAHASCFSTSVPARIPVLLALHNILHGWGSKASTQLNMVDGKGGGWF